MEQDTKVAEVAELATLLETIAKEEEGEWPADVPNKDFAFLDSKSNAQCNQSIANVEG